MVPRHWTRWPPCPYMVKHLKSSSPEPRKLWSWILVYSIAVSSSTKFVQMMIVGSPLTFLRQCQICVSIVCMWEKLKNPLLFQYVFKTIGWNFQCMIKVVITLSSQELSAVAPGLYTGIKSWNLLWNRLTHFLQFLQISQGSFCRRDVDNLFKWFCTIEQDGCHAHIW